MCGFRVMNPHQWSLAKVVSKVENDFQVDLVYELRMVLRFHLVGLKKNHVVKRLRRRLVCFTRWLARRWGLYNGPLQSLQGHDPRPLWLLAGTPSAIWPSSLQDRHSLIKQMSLDIVFDVLCVRFLPLHLVLRSRFKPRSPILYKQITCMYTSNFNVQYGTVILSLYFPHPNYEKNPTCHPLLLWKGIFIFFLSRITRFYTIYLGEEPQPPFPYTFTISKLPCHMCVCVERGL